MNWRRRMCPLQTTPCAIPKPITLRARATEKLEHEPTYMPDKPKFPLWVKSGHSRRKKSCPLYPESGHVRCNRDVRFGPMADITHRWSDSASNQLQLIYFVHMMFAEEAQRYPGNDRNQR
jgi:hypothetical protein